MNTTNKTIERRYLLPFILVGVLFLLWGVANNMNDTLLAAFKRIMSMTDTQTSLIQCAFYGSYFCFALPAALFIRRYSYKAGVILGLTLYAGGAMLFFPASKAASYPFFLVAIYVLAGGCSILETTANPYILSMGTSDTATRRLNIAQSLNPVGCIAGILISKFFILSELNSSSAEERIKMTADQLQTIQAHELSSITGTYMAIGIVLFVIMGVMLMVKMPNTSDTEGGMSVGRSFSVLVHNKKYIYGVIAQFAYIGAQIGVWSFAIRLVMQELHYNENDSANLFLLAMVCFCVARFFFTWLMKYYRPVVLMAIAAIFAVVLTGIVIVFEGSGWFAVCAMVLISFFMSLMFPTIYGIALEGAGDEAKIGASGLIMAILGGAVITPVQGYVSDMMGINFSFVVPLVCFVVVLTYALWEINNEKKK